MAVKAVYIPRADTFGPWTTQRAFHGLAAREVNFTDEEAGVVEGHITPPQNDPAAEAEALRAYSAQNPAEGALINAGPIAGGVALVGGILLATLGKKRGLGVAVAVAGGVLAAGAISARQNVKKQLGLEVIV